MVVCFFTFFFFAMLTELWKNKTQNTNKDAPREDKGASLVAQMVRNPPAMQETWVLSLGWQDPLEKGMATHSGIFARFGGLHIQTRAGGELCSLVPRVSEGPKPLLKEVGDEAPQGVAMPSHPRGDLVASSPGHRNCRSFCLQWVEE